MRISKWRLIEVARHHLKSKARSFSVFARFSANKNKTKGSLGSRLYCLSATVGFPITHDHRRLAYYHNIYRGRRAFLIGNGPSVQVEDLDKLTSEITFCCNRFHLAYQKTRLRPTFTISGDRQMIEDFGEEIATLSESVVFFIHPKRPVFSGRYIWIPYKDIVTPISPNIYDFIFPHGGSLIAALNVGYFMGIREFYMYGVDHNVKWTSKVSDNVFRSAEGDENHFIMNYRNGQSWCPPWLDGIEKGFLAWSSKLSEEHGSLYNLTRGGNLDVVPRKNFNDIVAF